MEDMSKYYNTECKYYSEVDYKPTCAIKMEMMFCSKNCAFCTNRYGSTKAYNAEVSVYRMK